MAVHRSAPARAFGLFAMACTVGAFGGLLGVGFQSLVQLLQSWLVGPGDTLVGAVSRLSPTQRLLAPAVGGLLAGGLILLLRRSRNPFGITDLIELAVTRRGQISVRASVVQVASSAVSIASGSSIGKEATNSQLAATVASVLARVFQVSSRNKAVLLGCGVAAGMATSYGAPIAGALFVMEVVLGNFAMDVFAPIVVASVVSVLVMNALVPAATLYGASESMTDPRLVLSALVLGILCASGSIAFRRSLHLGKRIFSLPWLPAPLRLGLAGLVVGALGIWYPEVWGNGYHTIQSITSRAAPPAMALVFMLLLCKTVATSSSLGSGALGGIFTPNLVVGAAFGAFFGHVLLAIWPSSAQSGGDPRVAFALVGMAGLCAATTHAPITSVLLIFEMTKDSALILPLMLCSISASIFARLLDQDSIYSERLRAKGHDPSSGIEKLTMQTHFVRDVMRRDVVRVSDAATFDDVMDRIAGTRADAIYVVDGEGRLVGHIQLHDIKMFINDPSLGSVVIAADLSRPAPTATPDESLAALLPRFDDPEVEELAVVQAGPVKRLLGRVTRGDVIALLSDEFVEKRSMRARISSDGQTEPTSLTLPPGSELARLPVPDQLVGRAVESLDLLEEHGVVLLMVIEQDEQGRVQRKLVQPDTVLQAGAELVVLGPPQAVASLRDGKSG
jgi:CIC family chloride channel protein